MTNPQEERTNIPKGCGRKLEQAPFVEIPERCGEEGYLCGSCKAKLSQHDKTMKLVMKEIDKRIKLCYHIDHKGEKILISGCEDEVCTLEGLKELLGGQK